ncbi:MAG: hypothetical protein ACREDR_19155 [Blastocatellia bacterium]
MTSETTHEAANQLEQLTAVAVAAKALVGSVIAGTHVAHDLVPDSSLTALESALADAGYDLTDEEFEERVMRKAQ